MPPLATTTTHERKFAPQYLINEQSTSLVKSLVGKFAEAEREQSSVRNVGQSILYHQDHHAEVTKRLTDAEQDLTIARRRADRLGHEFNELRTARKFAQRRDDNDELVERLREKQEALLAAIRKWLPRLVVGLDGQQSQPNIVPEALPEAWDATIRRVGEEIGEKIPETNNWTASEVASICHKVIDWHVRQEDEALKHRGEIQRLKNEISALKKKLRDPRVDLNDYQKLKALAAQLEEDLEDANAKIARRDGRLQEDKARTSHLTAGLKERDQMLTRMQDATKRAQRSAQLMPVNADLVELEVQKRVVEALEAERNHEAALLQYRIAEKETEIDNKDKQIARLNERLRQDHQQIRIKQEKIQEIARGADQANDEHIDAQQGMQGKIAQLKRLNRDLEHDLDHSEQQVQHEKLKYSKLEDSFADFVYRLVQQIGSPGEVHVLEDDVEFLKMFQKLDRCPDAPATFSATDSNKRADMAAHIHKVKWMSTTQPVSDFCQMLLYSMVTHEKLNMQPDEVRAQTMWMDTSVMTFFTSDETPLQQFCAAAMDTFLCQQLSAARTDGLSYAWIAGMQVQMMCLYYKSTREQVIDLSADIAECSFLEAIGIIRLKLARRYFIHHRADGDYRPYQAEASDLKTELREEGDDDEAADDALEVTAEQSLRLKDLEGTHFRHPCFKRRRR